MENMATLLASERMKHFVEGDACPHCVEVGDYERIDGYSPEGRTKISKLVQTFICNVCGKNWELHYDLDKATVEEDSEEVFESYLPAS